MRPIEKLARTFRVYHFELGEAPGPIDLDGDQCIAYDARECFYLNVLTPCGAPELTAHLCAIDDLLYSDLPGISWERTKTLGRDDDRCGFRFCRASGSNASTTSRPRAQTHQI